MTVPGPGIGTNGENLLFLLGLPRSGTTLLAEMLGNDPQILAPPEPWLMFAALEIGNAGVRHAAGSQSIGNAVRGFLGADSLQQARHNFARQAYDAKLADAGCAIFLDKTPRYYQIAGQIAALFPAARFIILRRNPANVALSYRDSWNIDPFSLMQQAPDDPVLFDLVLGPQLLDGFAAEFPQRQITVQYETLVDRPVDILGDIYDFIGRKRSKRQLAEQIKLHHKRRADGDMGDRKILATQTVHRQSRDTWRSLAPDDLARLLEWIGADVITHWGYADMLQFAAGSGMPTPDLRRTLLYRQQAQALYDARAVDQLRATSLAQPLSEGEQADLGFIFSGRADYVESGMRGKIAHLLTEHVALKQEAQSIGRRLMDMEADLLARGAAVETLTRQLAESETDRADRAKAIAKLTRQLRDVEKDRTARGQAIEALTRQLQESETDRAARGAEIERLGRQLQAADADHAQAVQRLAEQLREAELDRAARAETIEQLGRQLQEAEADRAARGQAVEALTLQLRAAETDRAARGAEIERLGRQLLLADKDHAKAVKRLAAQLHVAEQDRAARGTAIEQVSKQLRDAEADRAARGVALEKLGRQLQAMEADHAQAVQRLAAQLRDAEADRAARGVALEKLGRQLQETEIDHARAVAWLTAQLHESEADRTARAEAIEQLGKQLQEAEADRAARGVALEKLSLQLHESEADRAARLQAINQLEVLLREAEADRAARGKAIEQLTVWLQAKP